MSHKGIVTANWILMIFSLDPRRVYPERYRKYIYCKRLAAGILRHVLTNIREAHRTHNTHTHRVEPRLVSIWLGRLSVALSNFHYACNKFSITCCSFIIIWKQKEHFIQSGGYYIQLLCAKLVGESILCRFSQIYFVAMTWWILRTAYHTSVLNII